MDVKTWSDLYERLGPLVFMLFVSLGINIIQYRKGTSLNNQLMKEHAKRLKDLKTYTVLMMSGSTRIPNELRQNLLTWLGNESEKPPSE